MRGIVVLHLSSVSSKDGRMTAPRCDARQVEHEADRVGDHERRPAAAAEPNDGGRVIR
jgi:hypothetical protein